MITAELRDAWSTIHQAEASSLPSVEALDAISPLPMWLEQQQSQLRYCCSISKAMAAKYHLDMKFLTGRWEEIIHATREKGGGTFPPGGRGQFSEQSYGLDAAPFSLGLDTQMYQEEDLLVWEIDPLGVIRWLAMAHAVMAKSPGWQGVGHDTSGLEGLRLSGQQRTVERGFAWQYAYSSCIGLNQGTQAGAGAIAERGKDMIEGGDGENPTSYVRKACGDFPQAAWDNLLPLVWAQMRLVDAIALTPQRWVSAVDHLSDAWATWLSSQVLNDLCLRQMAETAPVRNLACLSQSLLGFAIRVGFEAEPIGKL